MGQQRERARQAATRIVAIALGLAGVALVVLAVMLVVRAGPAMLFLSLILGAIGILLGFAGFFFQLVPMKIDELEAEKRAYDERERQRPPT